jgi:hypothetical protein
MLRYYEAMLRAMLTDTPFVAIIDDDMLIAPRFLEVASSLRPHKLVL